MDGVGLDEVAACYHARFVGSHTCEGRFQRTEWEGLFGIDKNSIHRIGLFRRCQQAKSWE